MQTLNAKNLTLADVHHLLNFQKQPAGDFTSQLPLESLTAFEREELEQIRDDFDCYLTEGRVSEGQVKLLVVGPLLRLAGFYHRPIQITLEQDIDEIGIVDEDTVVTGRLDILAINKDIPTRNNAYFWVLVIESKNSSISSSSGLPQLLSYARRSLESQESVWGLTTNGEDYRFVHIQSGNPLTYRLMPLLNLRDADTAVEILQVLKAIRNL
jgi:hypothetical protein